MTSKIAYFRWHGKGSRPWYNYRYNINELEPWVPKVKEAANKDKELAIQEVTDNQVKALIRDYHIVIDLGNSLVLHDCADGPNRKKGFWEIPP